MTTSNSKATAWIFFALMLCGFLPRVEAQERLETSGKTETRFAVVVLGTAQDAGYPQAGCNKQCCAPAWDHRGAAEISYFGGLSGSPRASTLAV